MATLTYVRFSTFIIRFKCTDVRMSKPLVLSRFWAIYPYSFFLGANITHCGAYISRSSEPIAIILFWHSSLSQYKALLTSTNTENIWRLMQSQQALHFFRKDDELFSLCQLKHTIQTILSGSSHHRSLQIRHLLKQCSCQ